MPRKGRIAVYTAQGAPPHFIVIVPGLLGTNLYDARAGDYVWGNFQPVRMHISAWLDDLLLRLKYPNPSLVPVSVMSEVVIARPWAKLDCYNRLLDWLDHIGYRTGREAKEQGQADVDVYTFAYDWRQDNRISAKQLGDAIRNWRQQHGGARAWIIAHSNGGLVSRWYIENEGGHESVGKLILIGAPWHGVPKAMQLLHHGLDTFLRKKWYYPLGAMIDLPFRTLPVIRSFPSLYQLLPFEDPFLFTQDNFPVDLKSSSDWLDNASERALHADGVRFFQELGASSRVETICFIGTNLRTINRGFAKMGALNRILHIDWKPDGDGDETVPTANALVTSETTKPLSLIMFPRVSHGNLYATEQTFAQLEVELVSKYRGSPLMRSNGTGAQGTLHLDDDFYAPGQSVEFEVEIDEAPDRGDQDTNDPSAGVKRKEPRDPAGGGGSAHSTDDPNAEADPPGGDEDSPEDDAPPPEDTLIAEVEWCHPLAGASRLPHPRSLPRTVIYQGRNLPGHMEGNVVLPMTQGYYRVSLALTRGGVKHEVAQDLIGVEYDPIFESDSEAARVLFSESRAKAAVERVVAISEQVTDPADTSRLLSMVARLLIRQSELTSSFPSTDPAEILDRAHEIAESVPDSRAYEKALALCTIARADALLDRRSEAMSLLDRTQRLAQRNMESRQRDDVLREMALAFATMRQSAEAFSCLKQVRNQEIRLAGMGELALTFSSIFEASAAYDAVDTVLMAAGLASDTSVRMVAMGNVALALVKLGERARANALGNQLLASLGNLSNRADAVLMSGVVAEILLQTGERQRAQVILTQVFELAEGELSDDYFDDDPVLVASVAKALARSEESEHVDMSFAVAETLEDLAVKGMALCESVLVLVEAGLAAPLTV